MVKTDRPRVGIAHVYDTGVIPSLGVCGLVIDTICLDRLTGLVDGHTPSDSASSCAPDPHRLGHHVLSPYGVDMPLTQCGPQAAP